MALGQGVSMDGNEEVGLVAIGNVGTGMQGHEDIGLTGIDDLDVGAVLLDESTESQGDVKIDSLLAGDSSHGAGIVASVSCVDDQGEGLAGSMADECPANGYDEYQKLLLHAFLFISQCVV